MEAQNRNSYPESLSLHPDTYEVNFYVNLRVENLHWNKYY
jgi:hypothetical protein